MNRKSIHFDNKNIKRSDFYNKNKKIFNIDDIDANKILVSTKEQYGEYNSFKYFTGYNDKNVIRLNKITMSLMGKENYSNIWEKKLKD